MNKPTFTPTHNWALVAQPTTPAPTTTPPPFPPSFYYGNAAYFVPATLPAARRVLPVKPAPYVPAVILARDVKPNQRIVKDGLLTRIVRTLFTPLQDLFSPAFA